MGLFNKILGEAMVYAESFGVTEKYTYEQALEVLLNPNANPIELAKAENTMAMAPTPLKTAITRLTRLRLEDSCSIRMKNDMSILRMTRISTSTPKRPKNTPPRAILRCITSLWK